MIMEIFQFTIVYCLKGCEYCITDVKAISNEFIMNFDLNLKDWSINFQSILISNLYQLYKI